jgi:steroid 5-alpha reductase family enzyme
VGSYLVSRVIKTGHDSRFDSAKHKPRRFFIYWMMQALWALVSLTPVITVDAIHPAAFKAGLGVPEVLPTDILGFGLFGLGLSIETVADYQKSAWYDQKVRKQHDEQFITRGLWGRS